MGWVIAGRRGRSTRPWGSLALLGLVVLLATAHGAVAQGAGGGPDLIVNLDLPGKKVAAGATVELKSRTRNSPGFGDVGPSITAFFLSADTTLDAGDVFLGTEAIPALKRRASDELRTTSLTIPAGIGGRTT